MNNSSNNLDFSTILAGKVHDMKNSLAMLLGSITEISSECQKNDCLINHKFIQIRREGERVNRDLIQLLTLYKIDKSQYFINIEEVNIHEYLEDILLEYQDQLDAYSVKIEMKCNEDLSGFFDKELVSGVLKTIISNAYQYANNKILLKGDISNGYICLSIEDNGAGYPEYMLLNTSNSKSSANFSTGSTGLGLYFATQVANLHKNKDKYGYIKLSNQSSLGGGCFSLYLP